MSRYLIAAGLSIAAVALCVFLVFGGCGKKGYVARPAGESCKTEAVGPVSLGSDPGLVGRVESPATVQATLYRAEDGSVGSAVVTLEPGAWLLPGSALEPPDAGHE